VTVLPSPNTQAPGPTPFNVPNEPVVFADFSADGVTVYQTDIGQVCPTPTIECSATDVGTHPVLRITGRGGRSGMAVTSGQGRLALLAINETGQETISVVTLPTDVIGTGSSAATGSSSPGPGTTPAGTTPTPGATHRPSAPHVKPVPTEIIHQTPNHPQLSPSATNRPTRVPRTPAPTPKPSSPGSHNPGSTPVPSGTQSLAPSSQSPDGGTATTPVAILDHVRTAGTPAA